MTKGILLSLGFLLIHSGLALAGDKPIGLTTDLTFASKYMTDGFNVGGGQPVVQPGVNVRFFSTGLSAMFWSALQLNRSNSQYDELDFFARYSHEFFGAKRFAFDLHGFVDYWLYPQSSISFQDYNGDTIQLPNRRGNKVHAGISMTRLIPILGSYLVPSYNVYYWLYWARDQSDLFQGGARHELYLQYYHDIPRLIPGSREQYVGAGGSANYNDGAFGVNPGWTHSTAQVSTGVYALGCLFAASLNYQWSYEASVDPNNEFWSMVSFVKEF